MRVVKWALVAVAIAGVVTVSLYFVHVGISVKSTKLIPVTVVSEVAE